MLAGWQANHRYANRDHAKCSCASLRHANSKCSVLAVTVLSANAAAMFNFFMLTANVLQCHVLKKRKKKGKIEKRKEKGKIEKR